MRRLVVIAAVICLSSCADVGKSYQNAFMQCMDDEAHQPALAKLTEATRADMCGGVAQNAAWEAQAHNERVANALAVAAAAGAASAAAAAAYRPPPPQPVIVPVMAAPVMTQCNQWAPGHVTCSTY